MIRYTQVMNTNIMKANLNGMKNLSQRLIKNK